MAIKLIFEDNENTPSSRLLRSSYNGHNIFFSDGCYNVLDKAITIKEPGDIIYILYDLSPNNIKTVKGYEELIKVIFQNEYTDIFVLPIICIEYYVCRFMLNLNALTTTKLNEELVDRIVKDFDWQALSDKWKGDKFVGSSLEHAYKYIINNTGSLCMLNRVECRRNNNRDGVSIKGKFYLEDCNCSRIYCRSKCNRSLKEKAERLYTTLPVFTIISDEHRDYIDNLGIALTEVDHAVIKENLQKLYNTICDSMGCERIKISL